MMFDRSNPTPRQEVYAARASRARSLAWLVGVGFAGCLLAAIWQEPALSPRVHAVMRTAISKGEEMIARNDRVQAFLIRWSSAAQSASGERTDPVTALVQKINN
ncbi:MAG: hypothetical protein COW54_05805 [Rhodobacteraceae bacterium CG17_big_fil_post_rev_8_21_14_2_50_63_15]|nr:MAG: hypothetical protein COW54_05805 [Rhodobacteraceae bacterium CG17_big_fil_post_rev_8_21_14_2_50_63_15]